MKPLAYVVFQLVVLGWALIAAIRRDPGHLVQARLGRSLRRRDRARRLVPLHLRLPRRLQLLTASTTSVSPGQSQNRPSGDRAASSALTSAAKSSTRSLNLGGVEEDIEK